MRNITEEARMVMNTRRNFVNYAHVKLHDGRDLYLTPSDFRISGNSFTDDWNDGESFQLGSAIGKTATLLLDNTDGRTEEIEGETVVYPHGKFSEYDFYMSYFELYIHLPDATHYQGELIDEVISIGTFTVTTPASHGATIEITGVDNMYMFDRPFNDCTLNFSTGPTLYTILRRCCTDCGVAIGFSSFLNQGIQVYKKPKDVTYREVVSFIAQIAGCNAVISVTGALTLKYYDMTPLNNILDGGRFLPWDGVDNVRDTLDGGSFEPWTGDPENAISGGNFTDILPYHNLTATKGTTVSTDDIHFTGIMVSYEVVTSTGSTETEALHYPNVADWDTYAMHIDDNPFVETQAIANTVATSVWDVISPLTFRIFSCSSIQDPTIEAGDCALVYDVKGNIYPTIITNVRFVTGGMTEVSCTAESPVKQNSRYVNPAARAEAKAIQKQDDYNAMVAHFNELAYASTSYYETIVSGVKYLHDKPNLAESTNVVKITGSGVFISTDGGQSYNSGVDISTATMLMNLIYVKGIQADWIDVDKLSAISAYMGTVYVGGNNNENGVIYVRDENNTNVVTLYRGGISITKGAISLGYDSTNNWYNFSVSSAGAVTVRNGTIALGYNTTYGDYNFIVNSNGIYLGLYRNTGETTNRWRFRVTSGGVVTATSATLTGTIYAGANSTIGPWTVSASAIYRGSATHGTSGGMYFGTNGLSVSDVFKVSSAGALTCSNVNLTGTGTGTAINLGSGKFSVTNAGKLTCSNVEITGTNGTSTSNAINLSGKFTVRNDGYMSATSGSIAGWNLTTTGLHKGSDAWVEENLIACGSYGATHVKMQGRETSHDNSGYLEVGVNDASDSVQVRFNNVRKYDAEGDYVTVAWNESDRRLKQNIEDLTLEEAEHLISVVRPRKFEMKETPGTRYGFIAQELREVLDDDNAIEFGEGESYRAIHYTDFIAPLCMIINKQQAEIDDLKARLEKLESIVNTK